MIKSIILNTNIHEPMRHGIVMHNSLNFMYKVKLLALGSQ